MASDVESKENYLHVCRLCLTSIRTTNDGEDGGVPLFSTHLCEMSLSRLLKDAIHIDLNEDGPLPKRICNKCAKTVRLFTEFRIKCVSSDRKLRQIFNADLQEFKLQVARSNAYSNSDVAKSTKENATVTEVARKSRRRKNSKSSSEKIPMVCDECGITFSSYATLKKHTIIHTGRKDFCCDICDGRFARKYDLKIHMRMHSNDRPHVCEVCAMTFSAPNTLARHRTIHSGVMAYACTMCDRRFRLHNGLTKHMRTHTGARPHSCRECDISYTSYSGLIKHLDRYHPERRQRDRHKQPATELI